MNVTLLGRVSSLPIIPSSEFPRVGITNHGPSPLSVGGLIELKFGDSVTFTQIDGEWKVIGIERKSGGVI